MTITEFIDNREAMLWVKEWLDKNPHIELLGVGNTNNYNPTSQHARLFTYAISSADYKTKKPLKKCYLDGTSPSVIYLIEKDEIEKYKDTLNEKSFKIPKLLMELRQETKLTKRKLIL